MVSKWEVEVDMVSKWEVAVDMVSKWEVAVDMVSKWEVEVDMVSKWEVVVDMEGVREREEVEWDILLLSYHYSYNNTTWCQQHAT